MDHIALQLNELGRCALGIFYWTPPQFSAFLTGQMLSTKAIHMLPFKTAAYIYIYIWLIYNFCLQALQLESQHGFGLHGEWNWICRSLGECFRDWGYTIIWFRCYNQFIITKLDGLKENTHIHGPCMATVFPGCWEVRCTGYIGISLVIWWWNFGRHWFVKTLAFNVDPRKIFPFGSTGKSNPPSFFVTGI